MYVPTFSLLESIIIRLKVHLLPVGLKNWWSRGSTNTDGHWIVEMVVVVLIREMNRGIRKAQFGCFGVVVVRVIIAVQESVVIEAFRDFLRPHLPFVASPTSGLKEKIHRSFIDGIACRSCFRGTAAVLLVMDRIAPRRASNMLLLQLLL